MAVINNPSGQKLNHGGSLGMPAMAIPSFRQQFAVQNSIDKNILIYVVGGLGDAICAEPAIRWATQQFSDFEFTILSYHPELFRHLRTIGNFGFNDGDGSVDPISELEKRFNVFKTIHPSDHLHAEFIPHMWTNVIDYHSLAMWRCQLPKENKPIKLCPDKHEWEKVLGLIKDVDGPTIVLHPGKTWASRTIPAWWWDELIEGVEDKVTPILIGADLGTTGTVNVTRTDSCVDLRGKLSIMETVALCQHAETVVTNDSAPLHMAASGDATILYFATCKHPEFITHWREASRSISKGYKMHNIAEGGMYQRFNMRPNNSDQMRFDVMSEEEMRGYLPYSGDIADMIK